MRGVLLLLLAAVPALTNGDTGWLPVSVNGKRDTVIAHDLDATPLQIKTESDVGSGDILWVQLLNKNIDGSGIRVVFTDPPTYYIGYCSKNTEFHMPPGNVKIWTIEKSDTGTTLYCNGQEIFNYKFASSSDTDCLQQWGLEKKFIRFRGTDKASDEYRPKPAAGVNCEAGTYRSTDKVTCETCPDNTYSEEGADSCKPCDAGTVSNTDKTSCVSAGTGLKEIEQMILNLHNTKRAAHQANQLTWNSDIAKFAQTWCDYIANTLKVKGKLKHSPGETDSSLPVEGRRALGYGENLAWSWAWPSYPDGELLDNFVKSKAEETFNGWYNEKNNYDYSSGSSKNDGKIMHFTQVVWKGSTELGCGVSTANESIKGMAGIGFYLCCNYKQSGNYDDQFIQNVGRQSG